MDYEFLDVTRVDDVVTVTLDRPRVLNAVHGRMHTEISRVMTRLAATDDLGAVVLTGAGRGFCAGGDANFFATASDAERDQVFSEGAVMVEQMLDIQAPLIAAVNGPAMGLGSTIALFCDVVLASREASFGDPHVSMGVVAGDGGTAIWPALVGLSRAKEYLLTGDPVGAVEAERIGLVNRVVAPEDLLPEAQQLARRLADGPRKAISGTKALLNEHLRVMVERILRPGLDLEHETMAGPDHREAVDAFLARRTPVFNNS